MNWPPSLIGFLKEPLYLSIVDRELACLDDPLEEEVRLLELIPEEGVVLREEERTRLLSSHQLSTKDIEPREEPAASALLLVGDAGALYLDGELIFDRAWALIVDEEVLHPLYGDSVLEGLLCRGLRLTLTKLSRSLGVIAPSFDAWACSAVAELPRHRRRASEVVRTDFIGLI